MTAEPPSNGLDLLLITTVLLIPAIFGGLFLPLVPQLAVEGACVVALGAIWWGYSKILS